MQLAPRTAPDCARTAQDCAVDAGDTGGRVHQESGIFEDCVLHPMHGIINATQHPPNMPQNTMHGIINATRRPTEHAFQLCPFVPFEHHQQPHHTQQTKICAKSTTLPTHCLQNLNTQHSSPIILSISGWQVRTIQADNHLN